MRIQHPLAPSDVCSLSSSGVYVSDSATLKSELKVAQYELCTYYAANTFIFNGLRDHFIVYVAFRHNR